MMSQHSVLASSLLVVKPRKFNRQCVACREYFPKSVLLKITKTSSLPAQVLLNPSSTLFGRSLYCCNASSCLHKLLAKQGKFLKQRLKTSVLPASLIMQLEQHFTVISVETPISST